MLSADFKLKYIFISSSIHPLKDSIIGLSDGIPALDIERLMFVYIYGFGKNLMKGRR